MPFVNVYLQNKAYGGPEEGGWYYIYGETERCIPVTTHRQAGRTMRLVERVLSRWNEGRPSISSVASYGQYVARIEDHPATDYPKIIPTYE